MTIRIKRSVIHEMFMLLLPFFTIISQFFHIGAIRISWILYLIIGIIVLFRLSRITKKKELLFLWLVLLIHPLVSYIWSISTRFEIELYISIITGAIFATYIVIIPERDMKLFLSGCFISCCIFVFWGLYETLTGHYIIFKNEDFIFRRNPFGLYYPGVAFPNANDLAQYLAMLLPIVIMNEWDKGNIIKKCFLLILVSCGIFVIYHCYSHLGMISMAISFGYIMIYKMKKAMRKGAFFLLLLILFVIGAYISIKTGILKLLYYNLMKVETTNIHFTGRADIYISLLETAIMHPLGGFGNAYMTATPHNLFLYVMCDFGIIGAFVFAAFIAITLVRIFSRRNNNLNLGIFATIIAFPLTSCISSGNEQRKVVWIILGIGLRYALKRKEDNT